MEYKTIDAIHKMISIDNLLQQMQNLDQSESGELAILVHCSIFNYFCELMAREFHVNISKHSFDYTLKVGDTLYEMKLVYVKMDKNIENYIFNMISFTRCFLLFQDTPNLFISKKCYHLLEKFIRIHDLETSIVNKETIPGLIYDASGDQNITVVTFKRLNNWHNILEEYLNFLLKILPELPPAYYITIAFPWLQPSQIRHLRKPIHKKTYFVVHQFLTCLREQSYGKEPYTNLFDLCNMKRAFCDELGMNDYDADLVFEIDSLIICTLNKLKATTNLLANNQFNVDEYTAERNITWSHEIVQYFQYSFQEHFNSAFTGYDTNYVSNDFHSKILSFKMIKFKDNQDLKTITQWPNTPFIVDCRGYAQMDIYKFFNLIKYRNVIIVKLSTNHPWLESKHPAYLLLISWVLALQSSFDNEISNLKHIICVGENSHNFVQDFVYTLKYFLYWPIMKLNLCSAVLNCDIFDDTIFHEILFKNVTIDSQMLEQLHNCKLDSTKLKLFQCHLRNDPKIWDLICAMDNLDSMWIVENETTWVCFYDFVAKRLKETHSKEFVLTKKEVFFFIPNTEAKCSLSPFKFTMDPTNSKVVMKLKDSDKEVDLYYFRNKVVDDKSEYDFYN